MNREPISPELVLVDPELAERARRALPEVLTVADFGGHRLVRLPPRAPATASARSIWLPRAVVAATASAAVVVAAGIFESREVDRELAPQPGRKNVPQSLRLERKETPRSPAGPVSRPAPPSTRAVPTTTTTTSTPTKEVEAAEPETSPAPARRPPTPAAPPRAKKARPAPPQTPATTPEEPAEEAPRSVREPSPEPVREAAPKPARSQAPAPEQRATTTLEEAAPRTQRPAAPEEPTPQEQPVPAPKALEPGIGTAAQSGETSRILHWQPVAGASRYTFGFFRDGRQIFEASPTEPRVTVPSSWTYQGIRFTLRAGQYGWNVHAALRRERKLIVRATWQYAG